MTALKGRSVALSVSDAPDRARLGLPSREVDRALFSICTVLVCGFRGEWALISRDRGHAFRAMLGSHFTGSRAGWPTLSWSQA